MQFNYIGQTYWDKWHHFLQNPHYICRYSFLQCLYRQHWCHSYVVLTDTHQHLNSICENNHKCHCVTISMHTYIRVPSVSLYNDSIALTYRWDSMSSNLCSDHCQYSLSPMHMPSYWEYPSRHLHSKFPCDITMHTSLRLHGLEHNSANIKFQQLATKNVLLWPCMHK